MRFRLPGHVRFDRLEQVAAGEAAPGERERVLRHLESCASCRARYRWLRTLSVDLVNATRPPLPEDAEERIRASRAAGERVILPVRDRRPAAGSSKRGLRLAGAALVLLAAGGAAAWFAWIGPAASGPIQGELTLRPAEPRAGDRIEVEYRPGPDSPDAPALVLRGVLTSPPRFGRPPVLPRRIGLLASRGDSYRGSFTLGAQDVYGKLVVENADATFVDDRSGRFWHLHVHEEGRPVRDALWAHALYAEEWGESYEVLRRATELYPEDPRLQASRLFFQMGALVGAERDSALDEHRARLGALLARPQGGEFTSPATATSPERLAGLAEYTRQVGYEATARRFVDRLVETYPLHPEAIPYRVAFPVSREPVEIARYLDELESLWRRAGPHPSISEAGLEAALLVGRRAEILRWAERDLQRIDCVLDPTLVPLKLAETPAAGEAAVTFLREAIRELDRGTVPRPLGRTAEEHRRANREAMRSLLVALSGELLERGDATAALDTLREAASIGWSGRVHAQLAAVELTAGDTAAAARSLARATAAPFYDPAELGPELPAGRDLVAPEEWELLERAARDELRRHVLERSVDRQLAVESIHLFDEAGNRHRLGDLRHGTVTVVAFWNPRNAPARRDLSELLGVAYRARALGGEVVVITQNPPDERFAARFDEHETRLTLYHDRDGHAARAFGFPSAPEYHVIGFEGRIRFADSSLDEVLTQVDALLEEPRLRAAGSRSSAGIRSSRDLVLVHSDP